jgi:hypothetical protein
MPQIVKAETWGKCRSHDGGLEMAPYPVVSKWRPIGANENEIVGSAVSPRKVLSK